MSQRTYTKSQKKLLRKDIYDIAKEYKKALEEAHLPNLCNVAKLEISFPVAIMEADFKISLEIHRELQKLEKEVLDMLVFDETDKYTSENVRIGCGNVKTNHENRKKLLKYAMECDAMVGYWKLSK